ncbi:CAP domain-containing protein [Streptomyces omiyaensis]|uniref:CAP domain-containing protein n=1 Tax=Streptomyces omiyaensis TaxID=68247 RepID=UPI0036F6359B
MRYDGPDPSDPFEHTRPGVPPSGRHRRGGPVRRRVLPRPGFPAAVLAAGTTAAAVTVLLGLYAATAPSSPAPRAARAPALQAPLPSRAGAVPVRTPDAVRTEPAARRSGGAGRTAEGPASPAPDESVRGPAPQTGAGLAPQTGAGAAAPVTVPARAGRYVQDVIALANDEREKAGCGALRAEPRLARAAQGHADDMAARDYYAHDSPEGRDGGDRIAASGYDWSAWGENIHKGPRTPARAMDSWMGSAAHRANILNCSFRDIGVGVALTADGPWWVQDFGTKG